MPIATANEAIHLVSAAAPPNQRRTVQKLDRGVDGQSCITLVTDSRSGIVKLTKSTSINPQDTAP